MFTVLRHASIVGLLSMIVTLFPLVAGVAYAIRPTEQRLTFMRPISLAGIFGALCGLLSGAVNVLRMVAVSETSVPTRLVALASAEALVPLFMAFGCLTVAWLCVAMGLRRHS
ncbi:MAG TPA: hypothetical protein VEK56_12435 [Vicinamibacterales bacterium]|nr:hypothetical protein [Vicinamibacterales bacterium]